MEKRQIEIAARAADSSPITETMESNSLFTRREMLTGMAGMAGLAALTGIVPDAVAQVTPRRPRIACLVSYWGLPTSHADWICNKLLDGYWFQGAHTPSRVEIVSVYIHQFDTSLLLAQKVCKAKNIPIFKTVGAKSRHTRGEGTCCRWCCHRLRTWQLPNRSQRALALAPLVDLPAGHAGLRAEQTLGARVQ